MVCGEAECDKVMDTEIRSSSEQGVMEEPP